MTKKIPIIAGNWKMHKTIAQTKDFIECLKSTIPQEVEVWIAPAFTALQEAVKTASGSGVKIGAQTMHLEAQGAFTGEISAEMIKDLGCFFVILGHSERRLLFQEKQEDIVKKVKKALFIGLTPILCVGENLEEKQNGKTEEILTKQLEGVLSLEGIIVAYEPVWAIGTGKSASYEEVEKAHSIIAQLMPPSTPILYGGSVGAENSQKLIQSSLVSGFLVGGASLEVEKFSAIVHNCVKKGGA